LPDHPDGRALRLELVDAKPVIPVGEEPLSTRVNYFIGNDPEHWFTNIATYAKVRYENVYPGISTVFYPSSGGPLQVELEQDFELRPGADPSGIRMRFAGADSLRLTEAGDLELDLGGEKIVWRKPVAYQPAGIRGSRAAVAVRYRIFDDGSAGFTTAAFDSTKPLVIDPVIQYATYFGRAGSDLAGRMVLDAQGNAYIAGGTMDPTFPVAAGTSGTTPLADKGNAVLVKMNAAGTEALIVTHFGGTSSEMASGLTLDAAGNLYVTGGTSSPDFPVTANALRSQPHANDKLSCFVAKFNPSANRILYATYLGGTGYDACSAVTLDSKGAIYVAGVTDSRDYPATPDTFQPTMRAASSPPGLDVVLTKLNAAGTSIVYSTFLGGSGTELVFGLHIDTAGNAYLAGTTNSVNFPVTQGAWRTVYGGASADLDTQIGYGDGFVSKTNADASALLYSTYVGGREDDAVLSLAVDSTGAAYMAGTTRSVNFPVTPGSLRQTLAGIGGESRYPAGDGFVVKLHPNGGSAVYSTYLGGTLDERAAAIAVDAKGRAWVAGHTLSTDFPLTPDAPQTKYGGQLATDKVLLGDAFVSQLNEDGSKLLFSTYYGGAGNDAAYGIALTADGSVVVSGLTSSRNLTTTPGVFQPAGGGGDPAVVPANDMFLLKLGERPPLPVVSISKAVNEAGLADTAVSPGMVVVITGANFASNETPVILEPVDGILPTRSGETSVWFNDVAAPLLSVSPQRIVAIVPYAAEAWTEAQLVVEAPQKNKSKPLVLTVVQASPALYTADGSGAGLLAAQNEDGSLNGEETPAPAGTVLVFGGTGEGQTDPPGIDGLFATADRMPVPLLQPVMVWIGEREAELLQISGLEGQPAGKFVCRIRVPVDLEPGVYPIVLQFGDGSIGSQAGVVVFTGSAPPPPPPPERQGHVIRR